MDNKELREPTIHDPYTYWWAYSLEGEGRTRADYYVCYAVSAPNNGSAYGPGLGSTEREALLAACYWSNQAPDVRVVPISRAPQWAIWDAEENARRARVEEKARVEGY